MCVVRQIGEKESRLLLISCSMSTSSPETTFSVVTLHQHQSTAGVDHLHDCSDGVGDSLGILVQDELVMALENID